MAVSENDELLNLADDLVARARRGGADVAEAFARAGSELSVKVRLGETELVEEAGHRSVGMRVMKGRRVALTSTSDLSARGLDRFVADALELADLSQEDPFAGPVDPALVARGPHPDLDLFDASLAGIGAKDALERAREGEAAARAFDARITNSEGATFSRSAGTVAMALSGGFRGAFEGSWASLSVVPVADDDEGKKRRGFHYSARRHLRDLDAPAAIGEEAARRTLRKLGARKVASCEVPVVFDPDVARSIVGTFVGCTMGGAIWRKSSYLVGRLGTKVASELLTIVDDPLVPRAPGSRPFDGEGLASRRNVIVENGVLVTHLADAYAARKLGSTPTGSASRGGSGGVGASTTNCIVAKGTLSNAEIVARTPRGLYVTEMMGFGFNPVTGSFSRGASGFWIEDGKLAFPVSEVTISADFDVLMQSIDMVGEDLDFRSSTVAPTLRVAKMTIAGS